MDGMIPAGWDESFGMDGFAGWKKIYRAPVKQRQKM